MALDLPTMTTGLPMDRTTTPMLIDGSEAPGSDGRTILVVNPATEEIIADLARATSDDLDQTLAAADQAFGRWHVTTGATQWYVEEARCAYGRVIPAGSRDVRQITLRETVGVALDFAAWNRPGENVTLKIAAALAMARCFVDAGAPDGTVNIIHGTPAEVSRYLIASPVLRKVSLTGSTRVGKHLQRLAANTMKRCTMELGGHAPVLVFADAQVDVAIDALVAAKFWNAGLVCTSPSRFYVHRDIYDRFVDGFAARAAGIRVGNGAEPGVAMGPMITDRRRHAVLDLVGDARQCGTSVVTGGDTIDGPGYFVAPTVLSDVPDSARIMREEPFGPVAAFSPFEDKDDVIARANGLPFGLAAYVFAGSASTTARVPDRLEAGVVGINHTSVRETETPFGGVKESGYGAESGIEKMDAYLVTKMVTQKFL